MVCETYSPSLQSMSEFGKISCVQKHSVRKNQRLFLKLTCAQVCHVLQTGL